MGRRSSARLASKLQKTCTKNRHRISWVEQGIKGEQVVEARISSVRGTPKTSRVDNSPEFISKALDRWAYENGVTLDFSRPAKPTDNAFVESFNGRLRDECLNAHWFLSMEEARAMIEA